MRSIIQDGSDDWPPTKEGAIHIKRGKRKKKKGKSQKKEERRF